MTLFNMCMTNHFTRHKWLAIWMFLALLGYTVLSVFADNIAKKFIDLLLLGSLVFYCLAPRALRLNYPIYIFIWALVAALLSWGFMQFQHPDIAENSPQVHKLTYWMFLLPVAYALGGDLRKVLGFWCIAGVALLFAPWVLGVGADAISQGLAGHRTDLNLLNAQHGAMYFAVVLIGLSAIFPRINHLLKWRWLALGIWTVLTCYALMAIVMTQTRAIWLGVVIALLVQLAVRLSRTPMSSLKILRVALFIMVPVVSLVALNSEVLQSRVLQTQAAIVSLKEGEPVPFDSAGARINLWQEAMPWIAERPLTGWGVSGKKLVIQEAEEFPDWVKKDLSHMHNSFLDALVNFGVVGLAAVLALWAYLYMAALGLWRRGVISNDLFAFYVSFLVLWFVINCFESYMQFPSGHFVFALINGGLLSLVWRQELQVETQA